MSVSDPLLKQIKVHVYNLTVSQPIDDQHESLRPFCEQVEVLFRRGLRQGTSLLDFTHKDYWKCIEALANHVELNCIRCHPFLDVCIKKVQSSTKVTTSQGRGRYFIREALQNKLLHNVVELLVRNQLFLEVWYFPHATMFADEVLSEMYLSLLLQLNELNFQLCMENHTFLDDTWRIPIYKSLQLVPCRSLGLQLHHYNGRVMVASVGKGSVADDSNEIASCDVLDEMFGKSLRNVIKGTIPNLLKQNKDRPIDLSIIKSKEIDGSIFPPIGQLIKEITKTGCTFDDEENDDKDDSIPKKIPAHAILPDSAEEEQELPVHNNDKAEYDVKYIGMISVGQNGGVHQVEPSLAKVLNEKKNEVPLDVYIALGETDIIVRDKKTNRVLLKSSYTEISACGRRNEAAMQFTFLAGETTCTLAKNFIAYVFEARNDNEAKTILCSIAQGFDRTHWFV